MTMHKKFSFLTEPGTPQLVTRALEDYGLTEKVGKGSNPKITAMADRVAAVMPTAYNNWAADWYNEDDVPWCGLAMAYWAAETSNGRADRMPVPKYLAALSWVAFGETVPFKVNGKFQPKNIWVGDVLVFVRNGGGHVGICVGVTKGGSNLAVLGANQGNQVNITEIPNARLYAVRRVPYVNRPTGARYVEVGTSGVLSVSEQ